MSAAARAWPSPVDYRPGVTALPASAPPRAQDAKSPPLDALWPGGAPRKLDPALFTTPDWMRRERDALWHGAWICAGLASDAPAPGDWFTFDLPGLPLVIVRGRDGGLNALLNACIHRGAPLAAGDFGHAPGRLVCPFHSWSYALDGGDPRVTDRGHFRAEALAGELSLRRVRCETWEGFVFVCANPDAPPLIDTLGELPALLGAYRFADMHVVRDVSVDLAANWKLMAHANLEAYHFHALHAPALAYADDLIQQIDFYQGGHSRFITATGVPSSRLPGRSAVSPEQRFLLAEVGLGEADYQGDARGVRDALIAAKRRPDNAFGLDYTRYSDSQAVDDWSIGVFPNMSLNAHPEGVLFMRYLPHGDDPQRSTFRVTILMPRLAAGARPPGYMGLPEDADIAPATRPPAERVGWERPGLGWALDADCLMVPGVQRGMAAAGAGPVRLSELEARIIHFSAEYDRRLGVSPAPREDMP